MSARIIIDLYFYSDKINDNKLFIHQCFMYVCGARTRMCLCESGVRELAWVWVTYVFTVLNRQQHRVGSSTWAGYTNTGVNTEGLR